jgi:hypothetical protein
MIMIDFIRPQPAQHTCDYNYNCDCDCGINACDCCGCVTPSSVSIVIIGYGCGSPCEPFDAVCHGDVSAMTQAIKFSSKLEYSPYPHIPLDVYGIPDFVEGTPIFLPPEYSRADYWRVNVALARLHAKELSHRSRCGGPWRRRPLRLSSTYG